MLKGKMVSRLLKPPVGSFFLLGPRGTGKSTWLRSEYKPDLYIDLLKPEPFLSFSDSPQRLEALILGLGKGKCRIVIDEIQRIPELLNQVHALIEEHPNQYQFALTGSSARKLKRNEANLLAGRAVVRQSFPFSCIELGKRFNLEQALLFGTMPKIYSLKSQDEKLDYLNAYTQTYLKEEIQQEAFVRNLSSYRKFLKHLALMNGQTLNLSNLSREAGIKRGPLENYMSLLEDTLMGVRVEPLHLQAKVKEVSTPKFYYFDPGIVRSLTGELGEKLDSDSGFLFETLVLNELRLFTNLVRQQIEINYWGTPSKNEVDFILTKGRTRIGIEVKYSKKWKPEFAKGLAELIHTKKIEKAYVISDAQQAEIHGDIVMLPFIEFCKKLHNGAVL